MCIVSLVPLQEIRKVIILATCVYSPFTVNTFDSADGFFLCMHTLQTYNTVRNDQGVYPPTHKQTLLVQIRISIK